jgi:hypothetical protein
MVRYRDKPSHVCLSMLRISIDNVILSSEWFQAKPRLSFSFRYVVVLPPPFMVWTRRTPTRHEFKKSRASESPTAYPQRNGRNTAARFPELAIEFASNYPSFLSRVPNLLVHPSPELQAIQLRVTNDDTNSFAPASLLVYLLGILFTDNL